MSNDIGAAARAAAEAARRAAEEAARKRAAEAARKAAEAAAQRLAQQASKKTVDAAAKKALSASAGNKPTASGVRQALGKDELSTGLGRSLRARAKDGLGTPPPSAPTAGRTMSLNELRALQSSNAPLPAQPSFAGSPDAIERRAQSSQQAQTATPQTFAGSPDAIERRQAAQQASAPLPPTVDQRAAAGATEVQRAWNDAHAAGKSDAEAANAASQKLRELSDSANDPAYTNALLRASGPTIDHITDVLEKNVRDEDFTGDTDARAVKDTVRALSDVATDAGPIGSAYLADQIAQKLPNQSELMHLDDGFYEHVDNGGKPDLMAALGTRLESLDKGKAHEELFNRNEGFLDWVGDRVSDVTDAVGGVAGAVTGFVGDAANGVLKVVGAAGEMAVDVAKGTVELAGDAASWTTEQVTEAAKYAAENGLKLAGEVLNYVGDHAREMAADLIDVDGQINQLNSEGDTVTIGVGGSIGAAGIQGGAEVEMEVKQTENGYEMTLTGQLSGGVFAGLDIPGLSEAKGEANVTGIASATMTFATKEEAIKAAETVAGIGLASAVGGPAGALLTGASAGDEIRNIGEHFTRGSIGIELSASAAAELGSSGIGIGASVEGTITTGARIEVEPGKPPALVLEQSVQAEGSLALGGPVDIPSLGGTLNGGSLDGSATISAETRVPLPENFDVGSLASDPAGAVRQIGQNAIENSTTKLSLGVDIHAGVATEGLPLNLGADGGITIDLSGEAKTKDLAHALGLAISGDLSGALTELGTKTTLDVAVNSYTESGFKVDESIEAGVFKIGVKAEDTVRDQTEVWSFNGTPAELAAKGFNLFNQLQLNVS